MIEPDWPAPPRVRAVSTQRSGGISGGAYTSLNLAAHVGDDPRRVAANRRALTEALGLAGEPAWLTQVHGTTIVDLDSEAAGEADGAVTGRAGKVCVVMTADCLPVLLTNRAGSRVAAAHAGWRGLLAGVLPATVRRLGGPPEEILAWLGPAIGPASYEVGPELKAAFDAADPGSERYFQPGRGDRWLADLYGLARSSLCAAGVTTIHGGGFCTYAESERFFSHRRQAPCGRMATLIWLGE
jgi:hypothetical protein